MAEGAKPPKGSKPRARRALWARLAERKKIFLLVAILASVVAGALGFALLMPGKSFRGALPPADDELRRLSALLKRDVSFLAGEIGERNLIQAPADGRLARSTEQARPSVRNLAKKGALDRTWVRLEGELADAGYVPKALRYRANDHDVANLEASREGTERPHEIVVVGAHYDSAEGAPGADDNATGVASLLAIARAFDQKPARRTIRFVAFVNEEPPHFQAPTMGSLHYAKEAQARGDNIVAMLSLESLGYYRDEPGTQSYPPIVSWFFPSRGDFVAFVGDTSSRSLTREAIDAFRRSTSFPSEGAALPAMIPGVGFSDQWSFWQAGYPGVMVTDTALFRNPHYHTASDTSETIDYERLARVTSGLIAVVAALAN